MSNRHYGVTTQHDELEFVLASVGRGVIGWMGAQIRWKSLTYGTWLRPAPREGRLKCLRCLARTTEVGRRKVFGYTMYGGRRRKMGGGRGDSD